MSKVACVFVGWEAPSFASVEGAVHLAFPGAITPTLPTLEQATNHVLSSTTELLVLENPNIADLAKAPAMTDAMVCLCSNHIICPTDRTPNEEWACRSLIKAPSPRKETYTWSEPTPIEQ
jgi:hypothetical protein